MRGWNRAAAVVFLTILVYPSLSYSPCLHPAKKVSLACKIPEDTWRHFYFLFALAILRTTRHTPSSLAEPHDSTATNPCADPRSPRRRPEGPSPTNQSQGCSSGPTQCRHSPERHVVGRPPHDPLGGRAARPAAAGANIPPHRVALQSNTHRKKPARCR